MAASTYRFAGLDFVPNNYAANLSNEGAPAAFHLVQNFLASSEIGHALTEPSKLSGSQIKMFWETGVYDDGGETGFPSIVFEVDETTYAVTTGTVRDALGLPDLPSYTLVFGEAALQQMLQSIDCTGPLAKIGGIKRPQLRKEWSFFFDCITRAFQKKSTNWDAIPIDSL